MDNFLHHPKFDDYNDGALFPEFQQPGGTAAGRIVTDTDGSKCLLYQLANNGLCYKNCFTPDWEQIVVKNALRIQDPIQLASNWYYYLKLLNGNNDTIFVVLKNISGNLLIEVYRNWMDAQRGQNCLGAVKCGPVDAEMHTMTVQLFREIVVVTWDGEAVEIALPYKLVGKELRCLGYGQVYAAGAPKRVVLIHDHSVAV